MGNHGIAVAYESQSGDFDCFEMEIGCGIQHGGPNFRLDLKKIGTFWNATRKRKTVYMLCLYPSGVLQIWLLRSYSLYILFLRCPTNTM